MTARTERIYEREPYQSKFQAKVVGVVGERVELDRTAFYPGGGGQDPDIGTISNRNVIEVHNKDGAVLHKVPGHSFQVGQEVEGAVDWSRRLDLMRAHTGEHLLFSALNKLVPELELVKIAITPLRKSFIVKGALSWDIILQAETMVNQVIKMGVSTEEVRVRRDDPLILESRVKLERILGEEIRLVRIGDFDMAACAGVHVRNTEEISLLLVEKFTSAKPTGDFEIEFNVGERAVVRALQLTTFALRAAEQVGAHPEDLESALRNQATIAERNKDALARYARAWLTSQVSEHIGTVEVFLAITNGLDRKTLSEEATRRAQSTRSICVLVDESEKLVVVVAVSKDLEALDANAMLQDLLREHGGKGGGNRNFASGGLNDVGLASTILERSGELIRSKFT